MDEKKSRFKFDVFNMVFGAVVVILAALIPYLIKTVFPDRDLQYKVVGYVQVKELDAISIKIKNNGSNLEKNVQVSFKTISTKASDIIFYVDSSVGCNILQDQSMVVFERIRPGEEVSLSVVADKLQLAQYSDGSVFGVEIKSEDNIASFKAERTEFEKYAYPFGFWAFVLILLILLFFLIYESFFMSPEDKEKMVLQQIDKLPKG
ncbi:hypothetical protein GCM10009007_09530 [Formosimonas limnophila]|uniref:Uncharacterized protein n=1 Tax=Formosimonas limnophila TaxID=1384487 RepID=A0A8J3CMI7_9BURK|nr:hypothetical protein [Formosimonas limnophila]GHA70784.1 hypothetical protein GCM10009007_09530 [Formosimonas limnophila]